MASVISLPSNPYLIAFSKRLTNTSVISSCLPKITGSAACDCASSGWVILIFIFFFIARPLMLSPTECSNSARFTRLSGMICSSTSTRDNDNRSSISRDMRLASSSMIVKNRIRIAGSGTSSDSMVSTNPARLVSGERNSWLTLATKSRRTFSRLRCRVISRNNSATD